MKYAYRYLGAAVLIAAVMMFAATSCVIRVGPGDGETLAGDTAQEEPSAGAGSVPNQPLTPEEQAAVNAFAAADPHKVAVANTMAGYTNYLLWGTIESQGYDPATTDPETIRALVDQTLPWAQEEAKKWIATVDPAILLYSPVPKKECVERFGCPEFVYCEPSEIDVPHACVITDCDDARCRPCPEVFNLGKLVFRSWCSYVCVEIAPGFKVVGHALVLHLTLGGAQVGPICIPPF